MARVASVASRRAARTRVIEPERDADILSAYLEDASGHPPGRAVGLIRPESTDALATWLAHTRGRGVAVLPQAARSSLTAGAVPRGDIVVSVEHLRKIGPVEPSREGRARVVVGAGVRLRELQETLAARGWYFPPVPTYQEAMLGGAVSTNAGGAATFKYGTTRAWVHGLTIVLADGSVLEIERGQAVAERGAVVEIVRENARTMCVPMPDWALPDLRKISAGYHSAHEIDLVDLFIGAEGTLGVVTQATVEVVPLPPSVLTAVAFLDSGRHAVGLTGDLRECASPSERSVEWPGVDVRAVEFVDARGLALLREHGDLGRIRIDVPRGAGAAVLFEVELPTPCSAERVLAVLESRIEAPEVAGRDALARALGGLFDVLDRHGALDTLQVAFPDDAPRRDALVAFREAVPTRVNEILAERRRSDPAVRKVGGDPIVPFARVAEALEFYGRAFDERGLEWAVWGHLSDGNLHPNALARSEAEVRAAEDALLAIAGHAVDLGGAPLSEHGVGRSPLKQEMLRRFLGAAAIRRMRAIKRGLDPEMRLARGVIFPLDD